MNLSLFTKLICIFRHDRYFTRFSLMEDHHIQNFVEQSGQQHHYASLARGAHLQEVFLCLFLSQTRKKLRPQQFLTILFIGREIISQPHFCIFCILKNMALTPDVCRSGPCFYFFDFFHFYANL